MKAQKMKPATSKGRPQLLDAITSRTKAIALITLIAEAMFLSGAAFLPEEQRLTAFIICGAILGVALIGCIFLESQQLSTSEPHYELAGDRANSLLGSWTGTYNQPIGPSGIPVVDAQIQLIFTSANHTLEGSGMIKAASIKIDFKFRGGFLHDRFLRLTYENLDSAAVQFGSIIAELSTDGHSIKGVDVGFGATTRLITHATIALTK